MKNTALLIAALLLSACATGYNPQEVEAVRDYIAANDLQEVDRIRRNDNLSYTYINDYFVTMPTRRGNYLVEFISECRELRRTFDQSMLDERRDSTYLRARIDTIRSCRIGTFYEISSEQRDELRALGDAPGDETFLPEGEDN